MPLSIRTRATTLATGSLTAILLLGGIAPAGAAPAVDDGVDRVAPLQEFTQYWQPKTYDPTSDATKDATVWRGTVTTRGSWVLGQSDATLVALNHAGAADQHQLHRALVDADYDWKQTLPDALGPQLGTWFSQGLQNGSLPLTTAAFDHVEEVSTTGKAKTTFNYPRPFLKDRSVGGENDLHGLRRNLGIRRAAEWTDPATGITHSGGYEELEQGRSQAFPSGHTTYAYQEGIQLAMLVPQLGPEALARSSEAGNNRTLLGVHYPTDVMGGRILGHLNASADYSDQHYVKTVVEPARQELQRYLAQQCSRHGLGRTLEQCIQKTHANDRGGYTNAFTDVVSRTPVTDRASALKAYRARMTYGFHHVGASGKKARVPAGAENLLAASFPQLTASQRRQVLAATEIDSGYVLDSTSSGWQRLDLPAAMSAKVTVDASGRVVSVRPGRLQASVVFQGGDGSLGN